MGEKTGRAENPWDKLAKQPSKGPQFLEVEQEVSDGEIDWDTDSYTVRTQNQSCHV
jgi:hypothetical protein